MDVDAKYLHIIIIMDIDAKYFDLSVYDTLPPHSAPSHTRAHARRTWDGPWFADASCPLR